MAGNRTPDPKKRSENRRVIFRNKTTQNLRRIRVLFYYTVVPYGSEGRVLVFTLRLSALSSVVTAIFHDTVVSYPETPLDQADQLSSIKPGFEIH